LIEWFVISSHLQVLKVLAEEQSLTGKRYLNTSAKHSAPFLSTVLLLRQI